VQPLALAMICSPEPAPGAEGIVPSRGYKSLTVALVAEFLTDAQAAAYGRFAGVPSRVDLERFFLLDDADMAMMGDRRGDHNRLGFVIWSPQAFVRDVHDVG
jgi:Domain of unknown function (DUF4158)